MFSLFYRPRYGFKATTTHNPEPVYCALAPCVLRLSWIGEILPLEDCRV